MVPRHLAMRRARLRLQQISHHDFPTPRDVVAWLGAVQAQDWAASKWAVGLRLPPGATDTTVERAVDDGAVVRIHALRWTWQLIASEDVRFILALVRERLLARAARRHRELELDAATIRRSNDALAKALRDGDHLTRQQLGDVLTRAGVAPTGQRLPHLLGCAELEALICSGARRGKQPTWALFDARIKASKPLQRGDALAALARRYFQSRGPATADDFRWWSGLDAADARVAIGSIATMLASTVIDGRTYWEAPTRTAARASGAYLLPAFDEYLVAYQDRGLVLAPEHTRRLNAGGGMLGPCIVHDGLVVGTWRRTLGATTVAIEHALFARLSTEQKRAIALATKRYAAFVRREHE